MCEGENMSCTGCPLQTLADHFPRATTELRIWHERTGQPDRVLLSVTNQGEQFAVVAGECREAVAKLLQELDAKRVGDCKVILED
jgi:hypothetical protein